MHANESGRAAHLNDVSAMVRRLVGDKGFLEIVAKMKRHVGPLGLGLMRDTRGEMCPMSVWISTQLLIGALEMYAKDEEMHIFFTVTPDEDNGFFHAIRIETNLNYEARERGEECDRSIVLASVGGHESEFIGGFGPNRPEEIDDVGSLAYCAVQTILALPLHCGLTDERFTPFGRKPQSWARKFG